MDTLYAETTAALYEAAALPEEWPSALAMVTQLVGGRFTHLFLQDTRSGAVPMSALGALSGQAPDPAGESAYVSYYRGLDPRMAAISTLPLGKAVSCTNLVSAEVIDKSEFFNDFFLPHDVKWTALANFDAGPELIGTCGVLRRPKSGPFEPRDVAVFQSILGHVQRATKLWRRLHAATRTGSLAIAALDQSSSPIIAVNRGGTVLFANKAAEEFLRRGDIFRLRVGKLVGAVGTSEKALSAGLIAALPLGSRSRGIASPLRLESSVSGALTLAIVAPLPEPVLAGNAWQGPAALILIRDPGRALIVDSRHLCEWFRLTPSEALLALELAEGGRPEEIATRRGVKISTVRSQMSSIFAKTGAARQSDLARLLSRLPAA